jgi:hypothetical protein
MLIKDVIEEALTEFNYNNNKEASVIYLDAYYLSLLAEEVGYTEDEVYFENALSNYAGCELKVLEDDGSEVIRIE